MPIERAKPLLGTIVRIRCGGVPDDVAHGLIDRAFASIAHIHDLMSFHSPSSDISRLNCKAFDGPVQVHDDTFAVLRHALDFSEASCGLFDISVAAQLVASNHLPPPASGDSPSARAAWHDIELTEPNMVRFHRPMWIDLGGIAKGYAVDCAIMQASADPRVSMCVNAGGDLRVIGPVRETVLLRNTIAGDQNLPVLELSNSSLASSGGGIAPTGTVGAHINGQTREPIASHRFVSVIAPQCVVADALTKIVLASGERAGPILKRFDATAVLYQPSVGWTQIGAAQ